MNAFAKRLKYFRDINNLTMREAARRIGVPETTYREWEYGRKIRGPEPFRKIAKAFGVSISELFGENNTDLSLDKRLDRIREDVAIVQSEIKKVKK